MTDAGTSSSTRCQNPEPVGASGSKQVTAKLSVPAGKPCQLQLRGNVLPGHAEAVEDLGVGHLLAFGHIAALQRERGNGGMKS